MNQTEIGERYGSNVLTFSPHAPSVQLQAFTQLDIFAWRYKPGDVIRNTRPHEGEVFPTLPCVGCISRNCSSSILDYRAVRYLVCMNK